MDRFVPRDDGNLVRWKTDKPHILVICGSQGAKSIFEAIIEQFSENNPYEWIVALGKLNAGKKEEFQKLENIQALEWIDQEDIAHLLSDTNLAITRGSATTLAEIDVF
jgi:UDP-N-acetylglucosamine:LPS N-acetylglucosamine transferase